jgi:adenylate cyclase
MSADAHGYSRLMGEDEEGTVHAIAARRDLFGSHVRQRRGRIVDTAGDSVLAEFPSCLDAVQCAIGIQSAIAGTDRELPERRRLRFRIGVDVGDVVDDGERIYGDSVNTAARLQALADAGGVCISAAVHDRVHGKLALEYEDLGLRQLKNLSRPVRVYRVTVPREPRAGTDGEPAAPASIAVLPFTNMSGDPEQEYFSDGMTEDLITELARLSGVFVIARNSVFVYKGRAVDVREVARELGVRYVLEGSVRKAAGRVRITAQLVDGRTGHHRWAERYDRRLADVFGVQDEITAHITDALAMTLAHGGEARRAARAPAGAEAYESYLRGVQYFWRGSRESNAQARRVLEQAVALDPTYAEAHAMLALTHFQEWSMLWSDDAATLDRAFALASHALALDDSLPKAHGTLGVVHVWRRQHDLAIREGERAVALAPGDADGHWKLGEILTWSCSPEEAIASVRRATRLDPHYPFTHEWTLGHAQYLLGRHEDATATLRRALTRNPDWFPAHAYLAAIYGETGRRDDARTAVGEMLRLSPTVRLAEVARRLPYRDAGPLERVLDGARAAGVPDG